MNKVVVIGDSHSQLFDNVPNFKRGTWKDNSLSNVFEIKWIGPVTYWRLCRDQESFIDFSKDINYTPYPGMGITTKNNLGGEIMLSLGEIDIRCQIIKHGGDNYKSIIDDMSLKIEEFITKFNSDYKIHLISVLPPINKDKCTSPNDKFPFIGTDKQRSDVTICFNEKLLYISKKYDLGYFDLHSIYRDKDNMLDFEKSDKIVHAIKTDELEAYIKQYFSL